MHEAVHRRLQHPYHRQRLRYDSSFYLELSYCYENALPHSEFLSWSAEDRSKTLAFALEKSLRCVSCGTAGWEWEQDKGAYEPVNVMCWGCYHRDGHRRDSTGDTSGVTVTLVPSKGEV